MSDINEVRGRLERALLAGMAPMFVDDVDALLADHARLLDLINGHPARHSDDRAVDAFAIAMKLKLAEARANGRGGWHDPAQCSADDLSRMLREHVAKGDPRDVANFCMMLHQRGEGIEQPTKGEGES